MMANSSLIASEKPKGPSNRYDAIVVGVSAGGLQALETVLGDLPENYSIAVMIVQHRNKKSDDFLCRFLDDLCALRVTEAEDKIPIKAGHVYIAPPDYHLQVEMNRTLSLSVDPPVNYSRPAIDVLFETAAEAYTDRLVGVVLTGANSDGSRGLQTIKKLGGLTIVQDPKTAVASEMPGAALDMVRVDHVLPLEKIGRFLAELNRR